MEPACHFLTRSYTPDRARVRPSGMFLNWIHRCYQTSQHPGDIRNQQQKSRVGWKQPLTETQDSPVQLPDQRRCGGRSCRLDAAAGAREEQGAAAQVAWEGQGPLCRGTGKDRGRRAGGLGSSPRTRGLLHIRTTVFLLCPQTSDLQLQPLSVWPAGDPLPSRPEITRTTLPSDPQVQARAALEVKMCERWTDGPEDKEEMGAVLGTLSQRKSAEIPSAARGFGGR